MDAGKCENCDVHFGTKGPTRPSKEICGHHFCVKCVAGMDSCIICRPDEVDSTSFTLTSGIPGTSSNSDILSRNEEKKVVSNRGFAIICTHSVFTTEKELSNRPSAAEDNDMLKKSLRKYGFEVISVSDKMKEYYTNSVCDEVKNGMKDKDFFLFALSTHGEEMIELDLHKKQGKGETTQTNKGIEGGTIEPPHGIKKKDDKLKANEIHGNQELKRGTSDTHSNQNRGGHHIDITEIQRNQDIKEISTESQSKHETSANTECVEKKKATLDQYTIQHMFFAKDGALYTQKLIDRISALKEIKGKLKIFIIQACRSRASEGNVDKGVTVPVEPTESTSKIPKRTEVNANTPFTMVEEEIKETEADYNSRSITTKSEREKSMDQRVINQVEPTKQSTDLNACMAANDHPDKKLQPQTFSDARPDYSEVNSITAEPDKDEKDNVVPDLAEPTFSHVNKCVPANKHPDRKIQNPFYATEESSEGNLVLADDETIVVFASMTGKNAYSLAYHKDQGGWLVREFCRVLDENVPQEEDMSEKKINILDILIDVNRKVSQREMVNPDKNHEGLKSQSCFSHCLTLKDKYLFLNCVNQRKEIINV